MTAKAKWLIGLVAVLITLNVVLMANVWKGNVQTQHIMPVGGGDARQYLIDALSLNQQQVHSFDSLRKGHFERIRNYQDGIHQSKDALFDQLSQSDANKADSLAASIGQWQAKLDLETFHHFQQLRSLLTPAQSQQFDVVIQEVLRTMGRPAGGPPPPGAPAGPPADGRFPH